MGFSRVDVERALVALQAVALCSLGAAAVLGVIDFTRSGAGLAVPITWFILTPLIGGLWVVRPHIVQAGHGVGFTMLAVLLATPVAVFGTLNFTIPVLLLTVALAIVDVSLRAGIHATIWILCAGFILLISNNLSSWNSFLAATLHALLNIIPTAILLGFGIALGLSLRSFEQRRKADQLVIKRLRHVSEMEKELLLSDERARSARELHDGLGHRLTLISMSLELAERMQSVDTDQAWEEIRTAKITAAEALTEMRTWVRALNPVHDASARGLAALELISDSFRGTGLSVKVIGDKKSDQALIHDDAIALLIYRAVQEGLTNALRHSKAHNVSINLNANDHFMKLLIINDFDQDTEINFDDEPVLGFGLHGISDRASEQGGFIHAYRVDDQFHLEISLPLSNGTAKELHKEGS